MSATLQSNLESTVPDPLEMISADDAPGRPAPETPSIVALIRGVRSSIKPDTPDHDAMLDAMRIAAEKRIETILGHSRRRHYGHDELF